MKVDSKWPESSDRQRSGGARSRQGGFVLTIELILITTILVIGTFTGVVAIRDALIKHKFKQLDRSVTVGDNNGRILGEMAGLDEHEAPLLFYIDRTMADRNSRALIGIRDDRFTSREPIYYTERNCLGTACIKSTSSEAVDSAGVSRQQETGAVSYLHALQGFPNYAIGMAGDGGVKGRLFRETTQACPVITADGSRYLSQRVVHGVPCENYQLPVPAADGAGAYCFSGTVLNCPAPQCAATEVPNPLTGEILTRSCVVNEELTPGTACNAGYEQAELDLNDPDLNLGMAEKELLDTALNTLGTLCCPTGTRVVQDQQFVQTVVSAAGLGILPGNASPIQCIGTTADDGFMAAEQVPAPEDSSQNALDRFEPPFQVNQPAGGQSDSDQWFNVAPDGEG